MGGKDFLEGYRTYLGVALKIATGVVAILQALHANDYNAAVLGLYALASALTSFGQRRALARTAKE